MRRGRAATRPSGEEGLSLHERQFSACGGLGGGGGGGGRAVVREGKGLWIQETGQVISSHNWSVHHGESKHGAMVKC